MERFRRLVLSLPHAPWLLAGALLSLAAIGVRVVGTGRVTFVFLAWNLFLAALPYVVAHAFAERVSARQRVEPLGVGLFLVWLAFLPNAPYVLTDFMHLQRSDPRLWWYDVLLLATCAGTAWFLGLASLTMVHGALRHRLGKWPARGIVAVVCGLCAIGVYLGRFLRFNSWDVVTSPRAVVSSVIAQFWSPLEHVRTYAFVAFFTALLIVSYAAFHARVRDAEGRGASSAQ